MLFKSIIHLWNVLRVFAFGHNCLKWFYCIVHPGNASFLHLVIVLCRQHPLCWHQGIHAVVHDHVCTRVGTHPEWTLLSFWSSGWGERTERSLRFIMSQLVWVNNLSVSIFIGTPLHENQDPGRLLLLCIRSPRAAESSCSVLRRNGSGYDHYHTVHD